MATTTTPNMFLPLPVVGQEPGPIYGTDQNNAFTILDAHDHSAGSGVQITPDGININTNLPFNGFSPSGVLSVNFNSQSAAIVGTNFASCVGGNLYFNDGSGNQIQITSGGGVAGSPGSIGSLTAPAAATYSAGSKTFLWTAASTQAAAMDNGAVTIRETNVAAAKGITLASPSSLAADYQLTFPAGLPASNQYFTSNSSGVISFSSANTIAAAITTTGADAIASQITPAGADTIRDSMQSSASGSTVGIGDVAISGSSGTFSTSSLSYVDVTGVSVTLTTAGRPVLLSLTSVTQGTIGFSGNSNTQVIAQFRILKGGVTPIAEYQISSRLNGNSTNTLDFSIPASCLTGMDAVGAGTYTYKLQAQILSKAGVGTTTAIANNVQLVAYEKT